MKSNCKVYMMELGMLQTEWRAVSANGEDTWWLFLAMRSQDWVLWQNGNISYPICR